MKKVQFLHLARQLLGASKSYHVKMCGFTEVCGSRRPGLKPHSVTVPQTFVLHRRGQLNPLLFSLFEGPSQRTKKPQFVCRIVVSSKGQQVDTERMLSFGGYTSHLNFGCSIPMWW